MQIRRTRRELHRLLLFPERVLRVSGHTDIFEEKIDQTLENKQHGWMISL